MFRKLVLGGIAAIAMAAAGLGFTGSPASAEVTTNVRVVPVYLIVDNLCETETGPILFEGFVHMLWYTTPEGHTIMRYTGHYKGTASDGTEYVMNVSREMDHWLWPNFAPYSDVVVYQLVSNGETSNGTITLELEFSPTFVTPFVRPPYVGSLTCTG